MLNKIIRFSVRNKLVIGLFTLLLVVFGIYEIKKLPIDAVPDITDNQVQVITISPSLGAPDVERLITFAIEQANSNIPGLKQIRSFSRFGLSVVTIVFNDNVDVYWARQQVTERLQQAQETIPRRLGTPVLAPVTTGLGEIYQYVIRPEKGYEEKYSPTELRTIQDWIVRKQLLRVSGVADVASFGGYLKQYEISVDPARLKANNVTIADVFTALEKNNENTGGAYIEKGPSVLFIRSEGLVGSVEDIQSIVVKNLSNGAPLLIRDVADVGLGHATRYGAMTYNGTGEVAGAVVMMLKGANSSEVVKNVKARVAEIRKTLPEGVAIEAFLDRSKMVTNAIGTVEKNLLEGALIVVFVLVLFLGNLRAGLIVASVIPLSMLFAVIMMNVFGVSGNLMSLGALDFGLIVDGAVIIVEAVMHRFSHNRQFTGENRLSQQQMDTEVSQSASRMLNSAVFGQIIILVVYLPIFSLQGIEGKMFRPMAQTVAFALLGAFILSLTYIPMMTALVLKKTPGHKKNLSDRMMEKIERAYRSVLTRVLKIPKTILAVVAGSFAAAIFILSRLGGEFIPTLEEGDFAIETRVLPGSSLTTSVQAVTDASKILIDKFPEVEKVVGKTGSSEIPTDPMPVDASDLMVTLKNKKHWTSAKSFSALESKMAAELEAVPGVTFGFQFPVQMRFNELMTGARQDVVCKIFGEDLDTLAHFAKQLGDISSTVTGSEGIYVETVTGTPQIVIRYDRASMAQYGLQVSEVNSVINTAFAGESSGLVYEGEKRFDMVVRLGSTQRKNITDVQNLLIPTAQGANVPLSQLATVQVMEGPNQIQREDAQRRIVVGFNVRGRDVQSMVNELKQKVEREIRLPSGYHITYGGAFENLEAAKKRLSVAVPVALLLIFLMLYFAFSSVREALLVYSAIPLSAIGGIFALALRGMPFSISAGIGFIALFGVAVLNGIVLIAEFNRLQKQGITDLRHIVVEGTRLRLRPVLMTATVASLGFVPMALSNGAGAEVQRPLATVVIGGLLLACMLTLFVLPVLYILFQKPTLVKARNIAPPLIIIAILCSTVGANAQTPITLQAAKDTAMHNNLSLRSGRLNADYLKQIAGSAYTLPPASATADYGQINSAYADNRIGVSQTIKFPTVYARQKALYQEEWKNGMLSLEVRRAEIRKQVSRLYCEMIYLRQKQRLLMYSDSLFVTFLRNATLRLKAGEANILEKTTAETQQGQIGQQLNDIQRDLSDIRLQFALLLNTKEEWVPSEELLALQGPIIGDTSVLSRHPLIQQLGQQQMISRSQLALERSRLLPDMMVGINSQTIRGSGADNKTYSASHRFQSIQVGLGIPLFRSAQKAMIEASKINIQLAESNYSLGWQQLESQYRQAINSYLKSLESVHYYESTALKNAESITKAADLQFSSGEINYLEWVLLINNAIAIRSSYIDAVRNFNQSVAEINSFTHQ